MSKSAGNFFTLRDLVLKGHKPSTIRYLLASVPYRNQLNFTFDGLQQAAASVDRLRNFRQRIAGKLPDGSSIAMPSLGEQTCKRLREALDDDLNTAQAQAAIFDMIRAVNSAIDSGDLKSGDVPALLAALGQFDQIFSVLEDDDAAQMRRIYEWAKAEGREKDVSPELEEIVRSAALSDAQIEAMIQQMSEARKARDFGTSDKIRAELIAQGIVVEQTKDGIRWRRK
jgi:cysteinyl-tRNA synthetase